MTIVAVKLVQGGHKLSVAMGAAEWWLFPGLCVPSFL